MNMEQMQDGKMADFLTDMQLNLKEEHMESV